MATEDFIPEEFEIKGTGSWRNPFECPWKKWVTPDPFSLLKWKFYDKDDSRLPKNKDELDAVLPILPISVDKLKDPAADKIQVTWVGHATLLVQFDGITILTDPVFREYCGPELAQTAHLGYKRYRSAAFQVKDIPHLDAVIVSHDHFDHLDSQSVKEINKKFPEIQWFVGKNAGDLCQTGNQKDNVTDLLWWEEKKNIVLNGKSFMFACTPAQHWCRRSAFDLNKRLWCSWVVKGPTHSFYFAGDTGYYGPVFKKIGEKYGPFSLSGIPIGCYEPRKLLKYQHMNPEEAVEVHKDVRSEQSVGIHWGAFCMTNEFYLEPPRKLEQCMGEDNDKFISLQHGETWVVGSDRQRPTFMDPDTNNSEGKADGAGQNRTENLYLEPSCKLEQSMGEDKDKFISLQHGETWVVGSDGKRPAFMDPETLVVGSDRERPTFMDPDTNNSGGEADGAGQNPTNTGILDTSQSNYENISPDDL